MFLSAHAVAWFARSNGRWKSPPRRAVETPPAHLPVPVSAPAARKSTNRPESPLPPDYGQERGHAS
jgi:hypothetical protein